MTDSIDTSEHEARPYVGATEPSAPAMDPITRAIELLREAAQEFAEGVSIDGMPDWANEPDTKEWHDEHLMVARALELLPSVHITLGELEALQEAARERERLRALINTPELENFLLATRIEAVHQVERWGTAHDRAKRPADWFWLVAYLAGKALHAAVAGQIGKARHHCISTAAALYNWHCAISGTDVRMCPGRSDIAEIVDQAFPGEAKDVS